MAGAANREAKINAITQVGDPVLIGEFGAGNSDSRARQRPSGKACGAGGPHGGAA